MSYELQLIDCNCNDCKFMVRDFDKTNYWKEKRRESQLSEFEKEKEKAIEHAKITVDEIIKHLEQLSMQESGTNTVDFGQVYWSDVKREIENL